MNRLLQRFVADAPAADADAGAGAGADADARRTPSASDNPQLESLLAPPPRAAAGPPRSSGARLYPLPPRVAGPRGGPPTAGAGPPRSSDGRYVPSAPPVAAPPPDHPAFYFYQHNPYQYQAQEFQRQQAHPPPPPSSSGSQRRGSGARSVYETVDLNDDSRPLPGRVAPPRSADGAGYVSAFPAPPRSTGSDSAAFFQQPPPQPQSGRGLEQQQSRPQQEMPGNDARSVSDLFAASSNNLMPQTPPLAPSVRRDLSGTDRFASPGPSPSLGSSAFDSPGPADGFALSASNLSAPVAVATPAVAPRPLGIARSPVQKPAHRRLSSSSSTPALGAAPPPLSARQLAMHDRLRSHHAVKSKAMSVDLDFDGRRARTASQASTTTDDSARLADMYKQMAERLQGEKQDLLKLVAQQAEQIAALQRRVAALEKAPLSGGARDA